MTTPTPDPVALTTRYLNAWQEHDGAALLASMAPGGTYSDPMTPEPLQGEALRGYFGVLLEGIPDFRFETPGVSRIDERTALIAWTLVGHHTGTFNGIPPSGRAVSVPGVDIVTVSEAGVARVVGYFDSGTLFRQMGLTVTVQP